MDEFGENDYFTIFNVYKLEMSVNIRWNKTTGIINNLKKCKGSGIL